jgi:hypothetical protein
MIDSVRPSHHEATHSRDLATAGTRAAHTPGLKSVSKSQPEGRRAQASDGP